jgi:hypothetical protein
MQLKKNVAQKINNICTTFNNTLYIENSVIMDRIIKLFLVTFRFVILATSGKVKL